VEETIMTDSPADLSWTRHAQSGVAASIPRMKISIPPQPDWVIPRPRLQARLSRGAHGPLTVVTGPPGAGKTIAVATWAAAATTPGPIAWVSLDGADHQPELFWPHVVAAMRLAGIDGLPGPPPACGDSVFHAALASALSGRESPVVLVLDDFQPDRHSHLAAEVASFVRNTGPVLRLVIITRRDPRLPLHHYRLTGELTEVRAADLAFGERETRALLAQHGVALSAASVRALRARTEGWAAGLRLAAMSMQGHPDPDDFAADFAGDDRTVVGYLMEEVIEAQPPELRRLLVATSIAERFNAALAAELAGVDAGRRFTSSVESLIEQNAFVVPLGHGWYRYHHIFRESLNLILRHESPGELLDLHRRAAVWFERNGLLADAVRQAVQAEDWRYASWLIVDQLAIGVVAGLRAGPSLADLADKIPAHALSVATEPEPALVVAAAELARGDHAGSAAGLRRAERLLAALPEEQAPSARLAAVVLRLAQPVIHPETLRNMLRTLEELVDRLPGTPLSDHPEMQALLLCGRGTVEMWDGRLVAAAAAFRSALPAAAESGGDLLRRRCMGDLALVEALLGRFGQAAKLASKAAQLPEISVLPAGRRVAAAHLAQAWAALAHCRPNETRLELAKARLALRAAPDDLMLALCGLVAAKMEIAVGAPERAQAVLLAAKQHATELPWLDHRLTVMEAEAHTAGDAAGDAAEAARRAGGAAAADSALALAHAYFCAGDYEAASRTLRPVLSDSIVAADDVRMEAWLLDARLAFQTEDESRGRRSLDRALRLGEREQLALPLHMSRSWLSSVLRHNPELTRPHQRLFNGLSLGVGGWGGGRRAAPGGSENGTREQLSARELDVLRRLTEMLTTEEIAAEMFLSINTVKTHLKSIFRKLAVTRRGDAVRRAQQLELL
jgi:LuxR family maltose regulon positive regulatory protein